MNENRHTSIRPWRWAPALVLVCAISMAFAGSGAIGGSGAVAGSDNDSDVVVRSFPLAEKGSLEMSMPEPWRLSVKRARPGLPPTISFSPSKGDAFVLLVTPLWSPRSAPEFNSPSTVRSIVEASGRPFLDRAIEAKLVLSEIKGSHAHGYAFSLKDGAPGPGEYEYMTQGAAGVGDLLITFTILTHRRDVIEIRQALDAIRSSKHVP